MTVQKEYFCTLMDEMNTLRQRLQFSSYKISSLREGRFTAPITSVLYV